jgi:hypothetical protein
VLARRDEVLCEASMEGYRTCKITHEENSKIKDLLKECDVIFNTVPSIVFTKSLMGYINKNAIY